MIYDAMKTLPNGVKATNGLKLSAVQWAYDNIDKMLSATDALGNTTTYEYDKLSIQTAITDALGRKTRYVYNDRAPAMMLSAI
jgi:YD repeat-containing protein